MTTLYAMLSQAEQALLEGNVYLGHGTDNAWDEAVQIGLYVLGLPPDVDSSVGDRVLTSSEIEAIQQLLHKRIAEKIPLPYLTHEAWFAGLKFYVDERVIIPRSPFGELIDKRFRPWVKEPTKVSRILDLCTGSGCIAIACAKQFPNATIDAVDISEEALAVATKNGELHHCQDSIRWLLSDVFSACQGMQYDLIISNPPYVDQQDMDTLPAEYHREPRLALAAGDDGLSIVHRILREASAHLNEDGLLMVEVGNSELALVEQYPKLPFTWLEFERGGSGVFLLRKQELG